MSKLRAIVQAAAAATASAGVNDDMKVSAAAALAQTGAPTLCSSEFEGSAAAAALAQTAASTLRSSEPKGSPAAAKGQNVAPTGSIAGSTDSKDSKVRGGGGSSL